VDEDITVISTEDGTYRKEKFGRNSVVEKLEDCNAPTELTLSQNFLIRKWDGKIALYESQDEMKW